MANIIEIDRNNNVIILGTTGTTTRLPFCTANRMIYLNGECDITSITDLTSWVAGTTNQITVTNDGDGTLTLSTPQNTHTGASPTFAGLTLSSIAAESTDVDKFLVDSTGVIKYRTGAQVLSDIGGSASAHTHDDRYYTESEINTAFADWVGTENITTLGTISTGTWEATDVAILHGGTGASTAGDARTNLGLIIGTNIQAYDAGLVSLAGLTYASDSFIKVTATDTYAIRTIAETKTDLSLNLVENTALSTWAGTINITTLGTIGTGTWQGTSISTTYTDAKCTDATADNTAGNETSHADVVQDGDFTSNGLMERTGAGTYSIKAIGTDVQAYHANLAAIAGGTWTGATSITTLGTIATVGNITIADGGTIGQSAGPLLTFDDTNNYLGITGCYVGIGTATPTKEVEIYSDVVGGLHGLRLARMSDDNTDCRIMFLKGRNTGTSAQDNDYNGGHFWYFYNDAATPEIVISAYLRPQIRDVSFPAVLSAVACVHLASV